NVEFVCGDSIVVPSDGDSLIISVWIRTSDSATGHIYENSDPVTVRLAITQLEPVTGQVNLAAGLCQSLSGVDDVLEGYPLLVNLENDDLDSSNWALLEGGVMFRDGDGYVLPSETEKLDVENHQLVAWVRLPEVSGESCPDLRLYPLNTSLRNSNPVWDAHFSGVWHAGDSTRFASSARKAYSLTTVEWSDTVTRIADAWERPSGVDSGITLPEAPTILSADDPGFALSFWMHTDTGAMPSTGWNILQVGSDDQPLRLRVAADSSLVLRFGDDSVSTAPGVFATGRWTQIALSVDFDGEAELLLDGHPVISGGLEVSSALPPLRYGTAVLGGGLEGRNLALDEIRTDRTALTESWLVADYRTQRLYRTDSMFTLADRGSDTLGVEIGDCGRVDLLPGSRSGDPVFKDRAYSVDYLPDSLSGGTWLLLANSNRFDTSSGQQACFSLDRNASLYVLVDSRADEPEFVQSMQTVSGNLVVNLEETLDTAGYSSLDTSALIAESDQDTSSSRTFRLYRRDLEPGRVYVPMPRSGGTTGNDFNMSLLLVPDAQPTCIDVQTRDLELVQGVQPGLEVFTEDSADGTGWTIKSISSKLTDANLLVRERLADISIYDQVSFCRTVDVYLAIDSSVIASNAVPDSFELTSLSVTIAVGSETKTMRVFRTVARTGTLLSALPSSLLSGISGDSWLVLFRFPDAEEPTSVSDTSATEWFSSTDLSTYRSEHDSSGYLSSDLTCLSGISLVDSSSDDLDPFLVLHFDEPVRVYLLHGLEMTKIYNWMADTSHGWTERSDLVWEETAGESLLAWEQEFLDEEDNVVVVPTVAYGDYDADRWLLFYEPLEATAHGYQVNGAHFAALPSVALASDHFKSGNVDVHALSGSASSNTFTLRMNGVAPTEYYTAKAVLVASLEESQLVTTTDGDTVYVGNVQSLADLMPTLVVDTAVRVSALDLSASGTMAVQVANPTDESVTAPFYVVLFEDLNGDYKYSANDDAFLGEAYLDSLSAQDSATLKISVQGSVSYPERLIYAFVDPNQWVEEVSTTNNVGWSTFSCAFRGVDYEDSLSVTVPTVLEGAVSRAAYLWDTDSSGQVTSDDDPVFVGYGSSAWHVWNDSGRELASYPGSQSVRQLDLDHDGLPEWIFADRILSMQGDTLWSVATAENGKNLGFDLNGNGVLEEVFASDSCVLIADHSTLQNLFQEGYCGSSVSSMDLTEISLAVPDECEDLSVSYPRQLSGSDSTWLVRLANAGNTTIATGATVSAHTGTSSTTVTLTRSLDAGDFLDIELPAGSTPDSITVQLPSTEGWIQEKSKTNNSVQPKEAAE
ncbi:MAG TPA: hypothetical protein VLM37_00450, partial [Fibrobacteraceae bacterium]|nr:hypothetical protein [Fibrobacteraceae bacterium]